jgi:prepilin-type N-terminal cleavage/methylation domain-containing protein
MKDPTCVRGPRGFTLIELLVVMVVMLALVALGIPALQTALHQAKIWGIAQEIQTMMRQARSETQKTRAPAVVQIVPPPSPGHTGQVRLFVDTNGNSKLDGSETVLASFFLPPGIAFEDKDENFDKDSVDKLSADPDGGPNLAIFQPDWTVRDVGAFRLADQNGNFMEVRVESIEGKVKLRKWNGTAYVLKGDNGEAWTWN